MAETELLPDLKPCPFCGDAPRFIDDTGYGDCQVFCANEYNGCPAPSSQSSASEPSSSPDPIREEMKRVGDNELEYTLRAFAKGGAMDSDLIRLGLLRDIIADLQDARTHRGRK